MKGNTLHQVVPAIIMAGAAAVPVVTTVEILTHVPGGGLSAVQPSAPIAVAPSGVPSRAGGSSAPTTSTGTRSYQGPVVSDPFGGVQATITVNGNKIADVVISAPQDNPRSASINQQAAPLLRSETLQAQSAQINGVSGATLTSEAYIQSLQGALAQAQNQGNGISGASSAGNGSAASAQAPAISGSIGGGDD